MLALLHVGADLAKRAIHVMPRLERRSSETEVRVHLFKMLSSPHGWLRIRNYEMQSLIQQSLIQQHLIQQHLTH